MDSRGDFYYPGNGVTWYAAMSSANFNQPFAGSPPPDSGGMLVAGIPVRLSSVVDGTSNTIMVVERPPASDGLWGWWDSEYWADNRTPARSTMSLTYSTGLNGSCPVPAIFKPGNVLDNCAFNAPYSLHSGGANFLMGDGSVRFYTYAIAQGTPPTLIEMMATRAGREAFNDPE